MIGGDCVVYELEHAVAYKEVFVPGEETRWKVVPGSPAAEDSYDAEGREAVTKLLSKDIYAFGMGGVGDGRSGVSKNGLPGPGCLHKLELDRMAYPGGSVRVFTCCLGYRRN